MTKDSKVYCSGEYAAFFEASATHSLSAEEAVAYSQSYYKELENQSAVRFAVRRTREEALEEGRAEGRAEGRVEGREEERRRNIEAARRMGLSDEMIRSIFS